MRSNRLLPMKKIAYLGSKPLGLSILRCLHTPNDVWRIIHPNDATDARSCLDAFQAFAEQHHLDLLIANSQSAAGAMLQDFRPDIVFVCGWYWLLEPAILDLPPLGCWGIHNSLLPKYRGASPLVWAIINGDEQVGSTVFRFCEGMDNGPILHQVSIDLGSDDQIGDVLKRITSRMLIDLPAKWRSLLDGTATLTTQDESEAVYCGQRNPNDGLIDWSKPAREVHNFIRAQATPYPGAFTLVDGRRANILGSEVDRRIWYGTPGQVLVRAPDHVLVSCGSNTALRVLNVVMNHEPLEPKTAFPSIHTRLG